MMKCIFGIQINIEVFYKLKVLFRVCVGRHAQSAQNEKFQYLWNMSGKTWSIKLIFCLLINTEVSYKLIVSLWFYIAKLTQSTQNNKFAIYVQYLKENMKDEVKHQR